MKPEDLTSLVGKELGVSSWILVDQGMIDAFAEITLDRQFIHIDPVRAAATPLCGTIAHGFLALSLLSHMIEPFIPAIDGAEMGINYGFDRIRFLSPVPAGSHVRGRFTLVESLRRGNNVRNSYTVEMEMKGSTRPLLSAKWIVLSVLQPPRQSSQSFLD